MNSSIFYIDGSNANFIQNKVDISHLYKNKEKINSYKNFSYSYIGKNQKLFFCYNDASLNSNVNNFGYY